METLNLDIVTLIENNPIIKLNGDYQSKLVNKIKNSFTNTQQQLFVSSFYCYLNYDQASDFVVKLNDVWKWIGFGRIGFAKTLLEKYFKKDVDYVAENLIPLLGGIKHGGGRPIETITMTIRTFKKFCMKARTSKADEIHDYYIKLESFVHEIVNEESNELRTKLLINKKENEELKNRVDELELINIKQSKKLQNFRPDDIDKKSQRIGNISDSAYILYAFEINNLRYKCGLWRYNKIGELEKQLRKEYANGIIKYSIKVSDPIIEKFMTFIMTDKLTLTGHKTFDGNFNTIKEIIDICERLEYILITNDTFNILDGLINFNTVENQK